MESSEKIKTGEILVKNGALTEDSLKYCLEQQLRLSDMGESKPIGQIIFHNKFASKEDIRDAILKTQGSIMPSNSEYLMKKYSILVHGIKNNKLQVTSIIPLVENVKENIMKDISATGVSISSIEEVVMDQADILIALQKDKSLEKDQLPKNIGLFTRDPSNSQILQQIMFGIFYDAMDSRASDIHINISKTTLNTSLPCTIFYRVDGVLKFKYILTPAVMSALIVRFKTEAGIDISESNIPQDGRIMLNYKGKDIDIRIATMPVFKGESITMRLLDADLLKSIKKIFKGYKNISTRLSDIIDFKHKSGGLIVVTGPTGSGKTTTLYGLIKDIKRYKWSVRTVEDPIEYSISNVYQTQVNPAAGLTFAKILRAQVRHDPDVLVVGEMRDADTVETALRFVESGHLVLTTLHAIDVKQSISRLAGMLSDDYRQSGLYVISNYLKAALNLRLVPGICVCGSQIPVSNINSNGEYTNIITVLNLSPGDVIKKPSGCSVCANSGYYGRVLVAEAVFPTSKLNIDDDLGGKFMGGYITDVNQIMSMDKAEYCGIKNTVRNLLINQEIDIDTAMDVLDLKKEVKG